MIAVLHVTIVKKLKACLYLNKLTFSRSQNLIPDEPLLSGQPLLGGQLPIPRGWPLNRGSTVVVVNIRKNEDLYRSALPNIVSLYCNMKVFARLFVIFKTTAPV